MHIAVVDDQVAWGQQLDSVLLATGHHVTSVQYPTNLNDVLAGESIDLALVDMDFLRSPGQSHSTGLYAMMVLAQHFVPSALFSTQGEENRALLLLACFHFFEPIAVVDKNSSTRELVEFVERAERGSHAGDASSEPYLHAVHSLDILSRLIRNMDSLEMWVALTRFAKREEVARAAHVGTKRLDKFLAQQSEVIRLAQENLPGLRHSTEASPDVHDARGTPLADAHEFARIHQKFFRDPTLRALIGEYPGRRSSNNSHLDR